MRFLPPSRWRSSTLLLAALVVAASAFAQQAVPPFAALVTDLTGTLSPSQRATLEQELRHFAERKGSQIAVLLVPTTQPETIEQYALRVAETWQPGRSAVDDGVVFVIAIDDRTMRIEVGYGLEGVIPDAVAKRVISEIVAPYFARGDFYAGVDAGVSRLIRLIDGEPLPPPRERDPEWTGWGDLLPAAVIGLLVLGAVLRALFGRLAAATMTGGLGGVLVWVMAGSLVLGALVAVLTFILTLGVGASLGQGGYGTRLGGLGGMGRGGFISGGGGFRGGGGGGFGGGGASGRW